jgi:hypothetical protein
MSTHGCFASPFLPSFFFSVVATSWWIPGARCHRWRLLLPRWSLMLRGDRRRPGVVRRSQEGGLASSIVVAFVFAFLRQSCLTYVCTQILLLPLTLLCIKFLYSSPRGPWLVIWSLYDFNLCLELCCDIFLWVPDLDRTCLRVWLNRGRHKLVSEPTACRNPSSKLLGQSWV